MVEKSFEAAHYRVEYEGAMVMGAFFEYLDRWIDTHGFKKEIKEQVERDRPGGKEIHYVIECWRDLENNAADVVRVAVLFTNVKDVTVKQDGKRRNVQHVKGYVEVDGFVETWQVTTWQTKPWLHFVRGITDRFLWKTIHERYSGAVAGDTKSMYQHIQKFFRQREKLPVP